MKIIEKSLDWMEDGLRGLCGRISEDARIVIILVMFFLFSVLSIGMTVYSIYSWGKQNGRQIEIEHIKQLDLRSRRDSINLLKQQEYGTEQESDFSLTERGEE